MIETIRLSAPVWIANAGTAIFAYLFIIRLKWLPDWPVDGGMRVAGRRLIGSSRTVFGSLFMLTCAALVGWLQGHAALGLTLGLFAYAGTLANSIVKRRLHIGVGSSFFLDHIDYALALIAGMALFHIRLPGFNPYWFLLWVFVFQLVINAAAGALGYSSRKAHQGDR